MANSVIFAGRSPCATVSEAVVRLGFRQTGQLVLSAAALGMFEDAAGVASVVRDHCVAVAAMTHTLATEWGSQCLDTAFAAGLLSDVGKLFALQSKELNYEASPSVLEVPDRVHVMERMIVGWDHAVLGGHLLHYWQLPAEIGRAVAWHHQPGRAYQEGGSVGLTVALMRLANSVEYQLRKNPELDEDFADELARSGEASYASLSRDILVAMWPKLAQARRDALTSL